MFVQITKSGRGKKYVSYLVRESFRTAQGPRSRTICNITSLPPEVRALVAQSLRGEAMVPVQRLELQDALSFGGLAVLRDSLRQAGAGSASARNAAGAGLWFGGRRKLR